MVKVHEQVIGMNVYFPDSIQPRPQGFSLKKWVGPGKGWGGAFSRPHPFFEGKALGTRLDSIERVLRVLERRETSTAKARARDSRANWETGF